MRLHATGVIPASFSDQLAAQRLAMCNDIGEASYIDSFIAASLLQVLRELPSFPAIDERLKLRFKFPLAPSMTGTLPTVFWTWQVSLSYREVLMKHCLLQHSAAAKYKAQITEGHGAYMWDPKSCTEFEM